MTKILVVDDDAALTRLIDAVLTRYGIEVAAAHDGAAALDRMRNEAFDLIVTDIVMPLTDGYEFLKTARALWGEKTPPAVVITSVDVAVWRLCPGIVKAILPKPSTSLHSLPSYAALQRWPRERYTPDFHT